MGLKYYLPAIIAWLLCSHHLQAQVSIGSLNAPKGGTLVDLNSGAKGGLLLSNVDITDLGKIPDGFVGITKETNTTDLKGSVVYNTNASTGGPGIFVWDGTQWNKLAPSTNCDPVGAPEIQSAPNNESLNTQFTIQSKLTFEINPDYIVRWYKKSESGDWTIISGADSLTLKTSESSTGKYSYYCEVAPTCNPSFSKKSQSVEVIVCNGCLPNTPAKITLSSSILNTKANRKYITASVIKDKDTKVSYTWTLPDGLTGSSNTNTINIYFEGTTPKIYEAGTIKVTLSNASGSSLPATNQQPLKVYNCPGVVIEGGVHDRNNRMIEGGWIYPDLTEKYGIFTRNTDKDLCVYYRDNKTNNVPGNEMGFSWTSAINYSYDCKRAPNGNDMSIDLGDDLGGWRLPNAAELAQMAVTSTSSAEWAPLWNDMNGFQKKYSNNIDTRTTNLTVRTNALGTVQENYYITDDSSVLFFPYEAYAYPVTASPYKKHHLRCVKTLN